MPLELLINDFDMYVKMDSRFFSIMDSKFGIEFYLSTQCMIMNSLLLTFIFSTKEFRTWQFFPLVMQAVVDIIGAGATNLLFEWKWKNKLRLLAETFQELYPYGEIRLSSPFELYYIEGNGSCAIMLLRCLLNEFTTGVCLLVTAVYRYIFVCRPEIQIPPKVFKIVPVVTLSFIFVAFAASCVDFYLVEPRYMFRDSVFTQQ